MRKHWLYSLSCREYKIEIDEETQCWQCLHRKVCSQNMEKLCSNFTFGTSQYKGCSSCLHRYARGDNRQPLPCFHCKHFLFDPDHLDTLKDKEESLRWVEERKKAFAAGIAMSDKLIAEEEKEKDD